MGGQGAAGTGNRGGEEDVTQPVKGIRGALFYGLGCGGAVHHYKLVFVLNICVFDSVPHKADGLIL